MSYLKIKKIIEMFYSSIESTNGYVEIFKNPTISELKTLVRDSDEHDLRFYLDSEDNIYFWDANRANHNQILDSALYDEDLTIGGLLSDSDSVYFDTYSTNKEYTDEEIRDIFKESQHYSLFESIIGRKDFYININYVEPYED